MKHLLRNRHVFGNDRMFYHLKRSTRAGNRDLDDLWNLDSIWTRGLIKHIVAERFKRNDISTGPTPSNPGFPGSP